jgi:glycosyltransferase involved in cell wall biosynthesis
MTRPPITVAICTRNRAAFLEKAVRSVLAQVNDAVEILIVDNGSTDGTARLCAQWAADSRVKFFREPAIGLSVARNSALREARGDWIIFLDDDAEVEPGWLANYEGFFSRLPSPRVAVAGGAVIPRHEIPPPKWLDAAGKLDLGPKAFCFQDGGNPWECNCAYRREASLQAGGFDSRLGHQGDATGSREGADLNSRLRDAGHEVWWLPGASIQHHVHADRLNLNWVFNAAFREGRSIAIQRLKSCSGGARIFYIVARLLISPFHCAVNLLVALATFPFRDGRVAVKAATRAALIAGMAFELSRHLQACFRSKPGKLA